MRGIWNILFPWGAMLVLLSAAALFFGADTPQLQLTISGLILLLAALILVITRYRIPSVVYWAAAIIALFMAKEAATGQLSYSMPDYAVLAAALALVLVGRSATLLAPRITPIWNLMTLVFLCLSGWAFIDFLTAPETIFGQPRPYHQDRLSAAFLSANVAATFFGLVVLSGVTLVQQAMAKTPGRSLIALLDGLFRHGALGVVTVLVGTTCLMLTASRAGITLCAMSVVILIIWDIVGNRRDGTRAYVPVLIGLVAMAVIAGLILVTSGDVVGARYMDVEQSANSRSIMFAAYWQAHKAAPWFGHGLGSFAVVNASLLTADNAHILTVQGAAHNIVLQWLIETGWVGVLLGGAFITGLMARIWRGLKRRRRYRTYLRAILCSGFFVLGHNLIDFSLEVPGVMWWWAMWLGFGVGIAEGHTTDRRSKSRATPRHGPTKPA